MRLVFGFVFLALSVSGAESLHPKGRLFPLVMYDVAPKDFAQLKAAGFNCVHLYHSDQDLTSAKFYLEEARKHGLWVMQNMPSARTSEPKPWWANRVKALAGYDNLAWWYPPEESHADMIVHICEAIHENDPQRRPAGAYICWNSEKTIAKYKAIWDMVIKSSYPCDYEQPRASVISWMDNIRNAGIRCNIACAELWAGKRGAPNGRQLRFDQYAALVMGSKGMTWYSWARGTKDPRCADAFNEAKRFAWQMAGADNKTPLGEVILSKDVAQTIRNKVISGPDHSPPTYWYSATEDKDIAKTWPSLMTLEKRHAGYGYLFAVNTAQVWLPAAGTRAAQWGRSDYTNATVKAEFAVLPAAATQVEVLFEDRTIPVRVGAFQDTFNELDVHIYKFPTQE